MFFITSDFQAALKKAKLSKTKQPKIQLSQLGYALSPSIVRVYFCLAMQCLYLPGITESSGRYSAPPVPM